MEDLKKYHSIDQEQINKLNQQVSDYEAEINMLRRTISSLETERGRDKERINKLQGEVDRLRIVSPQSGLYQTLLINFDLLAFI